MEKIINTFFPKKCLFCKEIGMFICLNCLTKAEIVPVDYCLSCDKTSKGGFTHEKCQKHYREQDFRAPGRLITVFQYKDVVRDVIRKAKYGRKEFMALKSLCIYGLNLLSGELNKDLRGFHAVSVPPSKKNYSKRGFNQADVVSELVAKHFDMPLLKKAVLRKKGTESQYKYDRKDRYRSVKDAFMAKNRIIEGKNILVVDDIVTSGATLIETSKALYTAGAEKVWCFALSKKM